VPASTAAGTQTNTAEATTTTSDPNSANNVATDTNTVQTRADLSIAKAAPATTIAGHPAGFDYAITVTNGGPSVHTGGINVSDLLPNGTTFQPSGSSTDCTASGQVVTCSRSVTLGVAASTAFTIHVTVNAGVADGTVLKNTATVSSTGTTDPNTANDTSNESSTTVQARADLSIAKTGPSDATLGDPAGFNYALIVTNNGPSVHLGGVTATDTLPAGTTFQATGSSSECSAAGQVVTCTRSVTLGVAATTTFTIHVTVSGLADGAQVSNSAAVASTGTTDPNATNNTSNIVTTTVHRQTTSTTVVSSVNPSTFSQSVTFTATVAGSAANPGNIGTIQFVVDGGNFGAPVPLNANQAAISTSSLPIGAHTVDAVYSGGGDFSGSTGHLPVQNVVPATNGGQGTPFGCDTSSSITSSFNSTPISGGRTIWFVNVLKVTGVNGNKVTITFDTQTIEWKVGATPYAAVVPNARITFDPAASTSTTTFNSATNTWETTVPAGLAGNVFASGLPFVVPAAGFPGGINPIVWKAHIASDTAGVSVGWLWAASVYTSFNANVNALGVKPIDASTGSAYLNADKAGTPENYKASVTAGATGAGSPNYTGTFSGTQTTGQCGGGLTTYTQGGWGSKPAGNNPGTLLQNNFSSLYSPTPPFDLHIGDDPRSLHFSSAEAVRNFLPAGGTPKTLPATQATPLFNPTTSGAGVFAGQVLTLKLSVDFSDAGKTAPGLAIMKVASGPLVGCTVREVLDFAENVLSGEPLTYTCAAGPRTVASVSQLNDIVTSINENYDAGKSDRGFLKP